MSAIDAFTAIAVATVALYVARDSAALAWLIVLGAGTAWLARAIAAWKPAARPSRPTTLDPWLTRLPPPIARYPRARSTRRVWSAYAFTIPLSLILAMYTGPSIRGVAIVTVVNTAVWLVLRGDPREVWLYADRLAIVHESHGAEWWPFDRIADVRYTRRVGAFETRVTWFDAAGRRLEITEPTCAAHLATLLDASTTDALARRMAARLRAQETLDLDGVWESGTTLVFGAAALLLWIATEIGGTALGRESVLDRFQRTRNVRAALRAGHDPRDVALESQRPIPPGAKLVVSMYSSVVLAVVVAHARARSRQVSVSHAGLVTQEGRRRVAWRDVRRAVHTGDRIRLECEDGTIELYRGAWNAVLVPRVAAILAHEPE